MPPMTTNQERGKIMDKPSSYKLRVHIKIVNYRNDRRLGKRKKKSKVR